MSRQLLASLLGLLLTFSISAQDKLPFKVEEITRFDEPWSMAFLPDGRMLVTEKKGRLTIVSQQGEKSLVGGVPDVDYGGQGGLGDVALHPDFANNRLVYLSYAEAGVGGVRGAAVARGTLVEEGRRAQLQNLQVIWRQYPKVLGYGHYGHRILFDDNKHLWISSGDRQKFTPAQDMQSSMGKILRLHDDGSVPKDNPFVNYRQQDAFVDGEAIYDEIWSLGHRNPLGLAFDLTGKLWVIEMGPAGGDELNLVKRAANYGYPVVSNGKHYDGRPIPDHDTRPEFAAPAITWTPVISPADLIVYRGKLFDGWRGDALAAGLSAQGIVRIKFDGEKAKEVARYDMGARIRKVTEGPDGVLWVLEDERAQSEGRLLKLMPKRR
ncbi:PQQ-dependent sugar dehydrogenase [Arsukibacterium indicum]|uniref:PQQ-dependent sugar dehydrogenase n=1 Tax=Arsukibacterium indicum TaxID=2848612 RepID=A0ABS6MKA2_9GAMM|nr:PQQ-dependent sugar dehydrogenase [Arsukibacterium indicum]MBV2129249.1 PQQ-dependent sugar dehydrogenase [Arsukibacterium indicum]